MKKKIVLLLSLLSLPQLGYSANAEKPVEISVAAASDLKFVMSELLTEFKNLHPNIEVKPIFGSSGNFYAQIASKAPFDIYLSADIDYPRKLIDQELGAKGSEFTYAIGKIVIWVPKTSKIDVVKNGMKSLLDPSVKKIAVANPAHAPYGRAAEAAMKNFKLYDQVKSKLVLGENITQTAQYIDSGAADIGVIALSLAVAPQMKEKGTYFEVPLESYPTMEQGGMVVGYTKHPKQAEMFKQFLLDPNSRAIFERYGFLLK